MTTLPTGIVTFLFSDIEGSTRLLQRLGEAYPGVLEQHATIIRETVDECEGTVVSTEGDSFFTVFPNPTGALQAAVTAQRRLAAAEWPDGSAVRVRMGIHTGEAQLGGDNYVGLDVHRAARIASAGHGCQVLVSQPTALLAASGLPAGSGLRYLGRFRLRDLENPEELHQLVVEGLPDTFPPLRTLEAAVPHNLPAQVTSFVGRHEIEEVSAMIEGSRLVTLTGPGGTGKTRLSLEVASQLLGSFPDGVWFVALAPIRDPDLVTSTVAATLGLQPSSEDPDRRLSEYLSTKEMLLVLDNFEQVADAGWRVGSWLQAAPGLKALVSSRIPLRISGEQEFPVSPLTLPESAAVLAPEMAEGYEAVSLFTERARSANPGFRVTADNVDDIVSIVTRLDGLPLAIELAAARVKLLSPSAIEKRLGLGLLTGGARDLPQRQQTLRGAIAWSYDLLDEDHQKLFARVGVFGGSFTFSAAETVCAPRLEIDVFDGLSALVDHSLLRPVPLGEEPRCVMLETVREFALEKLDLADDRAQVKSGYADYCVGLAETAAVNFTRVDSKQWLDRISLEHNNLRVAIAAAVETGEADIALRLCASLWRFWQMRGLLQEGRRLVTQALALPGASAANRRDALEAAGGLAYWQWDTDDAQSLYREALAVARQVDDRARLADALYNLGLLLAANERAEEGMPLLDEAVAIAEDLDDDERRGTYRWGLADIRLVTEGDHEGALTLFRQAGEDLEGTGAIFQIGWNERMMATTLLAMGNADEAEPHLMRGLAIFAGVDDRSALALHVRDFAELALTRGDPLTTLRLVGAAAALQTYSETGLLDYAFNQLGNLDHAIEAAGQEQAEKLLAEGRAMSVDEILTMVGYRP